MSWKTIFEDEGYCLPRSNGVVRWWGDCFLRLTNIYKSREKLKFLKKREQYRKVRIIILEEVAE